MQKRVIALSLLLILSAFISMNFISAYTTNYTCNIVPAQNCNASVNGNIIVGLAAATNSHAEMYGSPYNSYSSTNPDPLYPYAVCCYFGSGNTTCSSTMNSYYNNPTVPQNEIIRLSSSTNAHSEVPAPPVNYNVPVCYSYASNGPLQCVSTTSGCDNNYYMSVVNLSGSTNAHVGTGSGFSTNICCKIVGALPGQLNCNLTSATWVMSSTMQGVQVGLNVTGVNCVGATITFNVTDSNGKKVSNNPSDVTFPYSGGGSVSTLWTSEYHSGQANNYKFTAIAIFNGNKLLSGTGAGTNATLSVSPQPAGFCTSINTCGDYNNTATCSSDTSLCNVALSDPNKDPNAYSYECSWNTTSNICNFVNHYQGSGKITCGNGYTLCTNQTTSSNYCYPGNTCPNTEIPLSNGNGICDAGEGCSSVDCNNGDLDNCRLSTCSAGMCYNATTNPVNITQCSNGYTLCYNPTKQLTYCNPSNLCASGDRPTNNSCANTSIVEGQNGVPSSCLGDSVCHKVGTGGYCASPTAATGKCVYSFSGNSAGCVNGFLTYTWTATWTGTGNQPANCKNGQSVIECPAQIPLPLFTPLNAAITIAALVVIYIAITLVRRSKKKKAPAPKSRKTTSAKSAKKKK